MTSSSRLLLTPAEILQFEEALDSEPKIIPELHGYLE